MPRLLLDFGRPRHQHAVVHRDDVVDTLGHEHAIEHTVERAAGVVAANAQRIARTDLRGAYKQLAETRSAEQTRVAEAQKQAQVQQQEETQRQVQVQEQAEADRIAQEQQVARERMATQAASQSMQVLGKAGATTAAPTAQVTRGNKARAKVRATSGTQGLRIGSSVAATGAGLNIGA